MSKMRKICDTRVFGDELWSGITMLPGLIMTFYPQWAHIPLLMRFTYGIHTITSACHHILNKKNT